MTDHLTDKTDSLGSSPGFYPYDRLRSLYEPVEKDRLFRALLLLQRS
jgi:hypothetical protein